MLTERWSVEHDDRKTPKYGSIDIGFCKHLSWSIDWCVKKQRHSRATRPFRERINILMDECYYLGSHISVRHMHRLYGETLTISGSESDKILCKARMLYDRSGAFCAHSNIVRVYLEHWQLLYRRRWWMNKHSATNECAVNSILFWRCSSESCPSFRIPICEIAQYLVDKGLNEDIDKKLTGEEKLAFRNTVRTKWMQRTWTKRTVIACIWQDRIHVRNCWSIVRAESGGKWTDPFYWLLFNFLV